MRYFNQHQLLVSSLFIFLILLLSLSASSAQSKFIYFIHSTEYPRSTFTVVDPSYLCLVADNTLDTIFTHLKSCYTPRKQLKVEVKGNRYQVKGRYIIKYGSVMFSNTSKAIIVEVREREGEGREVNLSFIY